MSTAGLPQLLAALDERGIAFNREDVTTFNSPQTKERMVKWAETFISPDTLLTREERILYALLSSMRDLRR